VKLADDGTFRIERLIPGEYVVRMRGAGLERAVNVSLPIEQDADVTIDAKRIEKEAEVTLHDLNRGFDDYLFVRVDDGSPTPQEIDVDTRDRSQETIRLAPGHMQLTVFPSKGKNLPAPSPGTVWIHTETLDLAPGEKRTIEIFPR
jgi:hypothetical protein